MINISSIFNAVIKTEKVEIVFKVLNLSIPFSIGFFVFLNPLSISALSEICFYLSLLSLIILFFFKKTYFTLGSPLTLPFVLFFIWAILGLFFTLDFNNTLHDLRSHLLKYLILYYLVVNYFNSQKKLEILSVIVIAGATVFCLWAVIGYYFIDGYSFSARMRVGFKNMPTDVLGFTTVFAITLAFNRLQNSKAITNTLLCILCIVILLISTFLTQCRGTLFGLFASLVVLCFSNRKMIIIVIAALILAFSVPGLSDRFDPEKMRHDYRGKINRFTMEVIKAHPITGIGFGMQIYGNPNNTDFKKLNSQLPAEYRQKEIVPSPHNTILDITARTGIIGLLLFLNILLASLLLLWKTFKMTKNQYFRSWSICLFACFISFWIPALLADTAFGTPAIVFYTILAMITIIWNLVQKERIIDVNATK